jgi:hypothetical protein
MPKLIHPIAGALALLLIAASRLSAVLSEALARTILP